MKSYELTITDDDALPQIKFTDGSGAEKLTNTVSEDAGTVTVHVEITAATEKTVTVPFTFGSSSTPAATGADAMNAEANFTFDGSDALIQSNTSNKPNLTLYNYTGNELSSKLIFKKLVESYLKTGYPAGSETIMKMGGLNLSSASIRSILSNLQKEGR